MDPQTQREIAEIRDELSRQGGLLRSLLYVNARELAESIIADFENDLVLAHVFLAIRTPKSQGEVVEELNRAGVRGASQPTVSRRMERLEKELGLISPVSSSGKSIVFAHSESASALRILAMMKKNSTLKALL